MQHNQNIRFIKSYNWEQISDIQLKTDLIDDQIIQIVIQAILRIEAPYFRTEQHGSDREISIERIYCYELYHQIRSILTEHGLDRKYVLHGEYDKSRTGLVKQILGSGYKPDFIVHKPGNLDDDILVMEVKRIDGNLRKMVDDLSKIKTFMSCKTRYRKGLMLVFGEEDAERQIDAMISDNTIILWHNELKSVFKFRVPT